ncbi:early nodulin-like protein 12 [Phragmites australis]|uniref:early nodulin-like protein 12 n=1 Tax=Phragmites australis TaxID=29695 RepID=UPI002D764C90|nr:early nodulin-like protein 12 [Phragmites australis]
MAGVPFAAFACVLVAATVLVVSASASPQVFVVGGEPRGWRKPVPNEETYNHWAARNRFHVGDFLHFKYEKNDSVLLVSRDDYKLCGAAKPTQRFDGGDTRFRLDHSGFLYFISGAPGHCDAGQRMTARVMAQSEGKAAPAEAPAMSPGEDDEGGSFGPGSGARSGGSKPGSGTGSGYASGSGSTTTTPHHAGTDGKTSGSASVRAPSSFGGHHVVVGVVVGAVLLVMGA